ncbi:MAG: GNAT family N-acetyltransferase [Clostridiales bacterium]|nr:GNAT family N-acetyltransferase [Clostridiales bacterium]
MLRPVGPEDRRLYLEMAQAFYRSPAVLHPIPLSYMESTYEEMIRSDVYAAGYFMMNQHQECMGYVLLSKTFSQEPGGQSIWVEELYVLPRYQGQGVGTQVLKKLQELYPHCRRFRLEVEPDNTRAIALYQRLGFEELPYYQMILDAKE